jgi:GT2 family glycosyltransferase
VDAKEQLPAAVPPDVSVVITARNAAAELRTLLDTLRMQTLPRERFEIVVVDDASDDDTASVAGADNSVRMIHSAEHVGLPRGRNIGIRAARASIIAFTDADCVPDFDWLERGLARLEESGADLLAGGITIPVGGSPSIAALVDSATYLDQERYTQRGFGAGANLWVRRGVFDRFGLFREELQAYGGDEEEFCQRATTAGAQIVYAPDAHVSHPPRARLRDLSRKAYKLGYGLAAHRRHNPGPLGQQPRLFLQPRLYLPRRRIYRLERLRAAYAPSRTQLLGMYVVQHLFVQVPAMAGDLMGELRAARESRRTVTE